MDNGKSETGKDPNNEDCPCTLDVVASNAVSDITPTAGVGNPINAATGNKLQVETDYEGGPSTHLSLRRYYNSFDSSMTPFGINWRSNWNRNLVSTGTSSPFKPGPGLVITAIRADGKEEAFTYNTTTGAYVGDPDVTDRLVQSTSTGNWQLTTASDTVETYGRYTGLLLSVTTRAGLVTTLNYNASNKLTTVVGPFGHTLTFAYDGNGRVSSVTLPDSTVYSYGYDGYNNLQIVSYSSSPLVARWYFYGNSSFPHLLTEIQDEDGNAFADWSYDSQGRATSSQHAGGVDLTTVTYNSSTSSTVTDADNNAHSYSLSSVFNVIKPSAVTGAAYPAAGGSAFAYDSNGFISSRTDFDGNVTTYAHNAQGEETSRTEAYGTSLARTISTTWSSTWHLPTQITEPNRTTTFAYNSNGTLKTKTVTPATGPARSWNYTYNTSGQVLTSVDPDNNTTTYTYDSKGDVATIKDALGHITSFTSYDANGRLKSMTDPNGLVTAFTYDTRGRLLTSTAGTEQTTYTYDNVGNLTQVKAPDGAYLSYTYDAAHRLTQKKDTAGDYINYTYDSASNLKEVQAYDPNNNLDRFRTYTYDSANRLASATGAYSGETTNYVFDTQGNLKSVTDPLSHASSYTYDALNRLSTAKDANSNTTTYGYNANDDLTSVKDPRSLTTTYTVDGDDDQTGIGSPDTGSTTRTFDAAGNMLTSKDARGDTTTTTYDALNRPSTITYSDGKTVTYTWDTGTYGIGHLAKVADPAGTTSYSYDQHGRVLTKQQTTGSVTLTLTYAYDSYGRLASIQYPSGKTIGYSYDSSGRVSALSTGASSVGYFPFGMSTGWTQANGQFFVRDINQDGLPYLNWTVVSPSYQASMAYDTAGRLTSLEETGLFTGNRTFAYDPGNRLTSFTTSGATTSYTYDANGNRTQTTTGAGSTNFNVASSSNQLSSLSGLVNQTNGFDADGHLTGDGTHTLTYDGRGRMTSAAAGGVTTTYLVNAFGQRIQKTGAGVPNGGANEYLYDEAGHLLGEYNSTGAIVDEIVWLPDTPESELLDGSRFGKNGVAAPVAILTGSGGSTVYSVEPDWLNAPYMIANSSKTPVWIWDHVGFGDNAPNQNPSGLGVFTFNPRFPGQYADSETGFSDNWNRTYISGEGQYVQSDPKGLNGGSMSTYGYVGGNPVSSVDPQGLQAVPMPVPGMLPLPIPPQFVPGTPQNQQLTQAELQAWQQLQQLAQSAWNNICQMANGGGGSSGSNGATSAGSSSTPISDNGQCEELLSIDTATCNAITRQRGGAAGAMCHASASERYAACLRGSPLPPLNTWNN